jgi:WD40 repeat protein
VTDRAATALPPLVGHTAREPLFAGRPDAGHRELRCTIKLWTWPSQEIATLQEHSSEVSCLVFSSDGNTLFTGSADATVRIWRAPTVAEIEKASERAGGR